MIKVSVRFQDDEQGVKNLDAAYQTVARILLKRMESDKDKVMAVKENKHLDCSHLCQS